MKSILFVLMLTSALFCHAQVGIGTNTPSTNAMLDVNSTNKGIMLPRLSDTTAVSNPGAGLMIYNMHMNAPAFHNGISWRTVAAESNATAGDSITYTITNPITGFTAGTYKMQNVTHAIVNDGGGVGTPGSLSFNELSFSKAPDINSVGFLRALTNGSTLTNMVIEIKFYVPGASAPYYSVKATTLFVSSFQMNGVGAGNIYEYISLLYNIIGYKDWTDSLSYAWNLTTHAAVGY